jgi:hypothetical protein
LTTEARIEREPFFLDDYGLKAWRKDQRGEGRKK